MTILNEQDHAAVASLQPLRETYVVDSPQVSTKTNKQNQPRTSFILYRTALCRYKSHHALGLRFELRTTFPTLFVSFRMWDVTFSKGTTTTTTSTTVYSCISRLHYSFTDLCETAIRRLRTNGVRWHYVKFTIEVGPTEEMILIKVYELRTHETKAQNLRRAA